MKTAERGSKMKKNGQTTVEHGMPKKQHNDAQIEREACNSLRSTVIVPSKKKIVGGWVGVMQTHSTTLTATVATLPVRASAEKLRQI